MSYINKQYWNNFYKKQMNLSDSSTFSKFIYEKFEQQVSDTILVDLGCGTGKDTFYFAEKGFQVLGIDGSEEVIKNNNRIIKEGNFCIRNINFKCIDLSDKNEVDKLIEEFNKIALLNKNKVIFYTRFFLHAITEEVENLILSSILEIMEVNYTLVAEFRTKEDEKLDKVFNNHYRRYIDTEVLISKLIQFGFSIKEFSKGRGFSIYKNEDPYLARIIIESK